jgi:hypothetical protein
MAKKRPKNFFGSPNSRASPTLKCAHNYRRNWSSSSWSKQPASLPLKQRLIPSVFSLSPGEPLSPSPNPYFSLSIAQCLVSPHPPSPLVETGRPSSSKYTQPTFYENFLSNPSLIDILLCKYTQVHIAKSFGEWSRAIFCKAFSYFFLPSLFRELQKLLN